MKDETMMQSTSLQGQFVRLEPLSAHHKAGLQTASSDDRIWTYNPAANQNSGRRFEKWFEQTYSAHQQKEDIVFVVQHIQSGQVIGTTRYYEISEKHKHLQIGYTWYHPDYWGTLVNPECKLLLLAHAFEALHLNAHV